MTAATIVAGVLGSAAAGWLAGGAGNWAADRLPGFTFGKRIHDEAGPAEPRPSVRSLPHFFTLPWYFSRHGVCPHCGERRSLRAPLLEAATAGTFVLAGWRFQGDVLATAVAWLYAAFLLTVLVIDLEHRRVLNVMMLPGAVVALLVSFLPGGPSPVAALVGGAAGFAGFFVLALIGRGALGMGDVKLAGVIGLMTGYPLVGRALVAGIFLGGLAAIALLVTKRATRKSAMAYAPYLALGALGALMLMPR